MTVVLTYTKLDGSKHKAGIDENISKIGFNYDKMISIDLSGIGECKNLQNLELQSNNLQTIDLKPLESCKSLQTLELGGDSLQTIDLSSLKSCDNLQELWLVGHQLQSLDISPLGHCKNLQTFGIGGSKLREIDLSPLKSCISLVQLRIGLTQVHSIDISPLNSCIKLQKLRLGWNKLQSIDLAPLSSCTNLQTLNLSKNELQSINLLPLKLATKLESIDLSENQLKRIDFSPLSTCTSLKDLSVEKNKLQSIDLIPLFFCTNMRMLDLSENELQSIDFTPVFCTPTISYDSTCKGFSWLETGNYEIVYDRPSIIYPWSVLYLIARLFGNDPRVQQDILFAMGFNKYGFIDCDLEVLFLSIPSHINIEEASKQVVKKLIQEIAESVDRGGTTTGLNLEELLTQHPEIAIRIQEISEIRDSEIRQVRVSESGSKANLQELWLTAFGYDVLTALGMKLETSMVDLEQIKHTFSDMRFELLGNRTSISGVKMGLILKMVVLWIIENRNNRWKEIEPSSLSQWWDELGIKRIEKLAYEERKRQYDEELLEESRSKFDYLHQVEQPHEEKEFEYDLDAIEEHKFEEERLFAKGKKLKRRGREDELDVIVELSPEEERLVSKGKKLKRREKEKKKKEKTPKRVQWRRS